MTTTLWNLFCFFSLGSSAWILVNAIYAEIPLIVASLDNDYSVISKLTLCVTLTSIAPILWSLLVDVITGIDAKHITQIGIAGILLIGTATSLVLSLTDATLPQTTLLVVSTASGLVGSMSRVLYFPHAATTIPTATVETTARLNDEEVEATPHDDAPQQRQEIQEKNAAIQQTTAMASGMAVASLFVAILAILQQMQSDSVAEHDTTTTTSKRYQFSIQAYFGVVTGIFGLAIAGFLGTLVSDNTATKTHQTVAESQDSEQDDDDRVHNENSNHYGSIETSHNLFRKQSTGVSPKSHMEPNAALLKVSADNQQSSSMTNPTFASSLEIQDELEPHDDVDSDGHHYHPITETDLFAFWNSFMIVSRQHTAINAGQFLLNAMTFFLPGIVPYSVQHFDDSQRALHYLTVTQLIAQTLGTMLSGWKQFRSVWIQLMVFATLWIPMVIFSFLNNTDFQHSNQMHSAVPITLNASLNLAYGYSSTTFYHLVHTSAASAAAGEDGDDDIDENQSHTSNKDEAHIASRVLGSWNQLGAMTGSLVAYFLVQHGAVSS
jgi:hypothetical protein